MSAAEQKPLFDTEAFKTFPTLELTKDDPEFVQLLREKLEQYNTRIVELTKKVKYWHPEKRRDIIGTYTVSSTTSGYQQTILAALLETGNVDTKALHDKLLNEQGENFDEENFVQGGSVISKYLEDKVFLKEMVESRRR